MSKPEFIITQKWIGCITDIGDHAFWCELEDKTCKNNPRSETMIDKISIEKEDWDQLKEGQFFNWEIGYYLDNPLQTVSEIQFSKEKWTQEEIDEAKEKAKEICKELRWE